MDVVAYNLVKVLHVLFIATGLGADITYRFWQGLAGNDPQRNSLILRGVSSWTIESPIPHIYWRWEPG